jgi:poly(3-hydroxybutyrate) depolymerase
VLNDRHYRLVLPREYDDTKSYKLLLAFHGSGGNSANMQRLAGFEHLSDDFIVAYPKSKTQEWNDGCGCNKAHRLGIDDLAFVDQVIVDIGQYHTINHNEIFAVGFSQGGLFAQNLLCHRSGVFKAVASVASPMSIQLSEDCPLDTPTSYMMVHGRVDKVLPFHGMKHANFGLISAPKAVKLLANKNQSLSAPLIKTVAQGAQMSAYWNGKQKTVLYALKRGEHQWQHRNFNTSKRVLDFFNSANTPELPPYSQLVKTDAGRLHVRTMGERSNKPTLVLLSGPNQYFHADSAWFSAVQKQLATQYRVHAIDRPGSAWSDFNEDVSYSNFVSQLYQTLVALGEREVIFATFSSGNITARLFEKKYGSDKTVDLKSMLWIDPDIFMAHSIAFYQDYPVTFYRQRINDLLPHIQKGGWTERTNNKLKAEREEIATMSPIESMDWPFYDAVSQQRLLVDRQQSRALTINHYHDDLNAVAGLDFVTDIPISVIDSDFEAKQIQNNPDKAVAMSKWKNEGTAWSKEVAQKSNGQYIPISNAHHLVPLQHPDIVVKAINWLVEGK